MKYDGRFIWYNLFSVLSFNGPFGSGSVQPVACQMLKKTIEKVFRVVRGGKMINDCFINTSS